MKKEVYYCDICNKELDNKRDNYSKQKYIIRKKIDLYGGIVEPELDICASCYERFVTSMGLKN
jgi:hypothetical protein